ncbi:MAG: hypothetical protein R3C58_14030 [Parvularculaceae bacterium]
MSAFDTKQRTYRHRNEISILLRLTGAEKPFPATVFASLGERASDLLNDARSFIPVRLANGETLIVSKTQIASVTEAPQEPEEPSKSKFHGEEFSKEKKAAKPAPGRNVDAYATLRISPTATLEEVRIAYKTRMKAVHPDAISALGLDADIAKAAVNAAQEVNIAYQRILRERGVHTEQTA